MAGACLPAAGPGTRARGRERAPAAGPPSRPHLTGTERESGELHAATGLLLRWPARGGHRVTMVQQGSHEAEDRAADAGGRGGLSRPAPAAGHLRRRPGPRRREGREGDGGSDAERRAGDPADRPAPVRDGPGLGDHRLLPRRGRLPHHGPAGLPGAVRGQPLPAAHRRGRHRRAGLARQVVAAARPAALPQAGHGDQGRPAVLRDLVVREGGRRPVAVEHLHRARPVRRDERQPAARRGAVVRRPRTSTPTAPTS